MLSVMDTRATLFRPRIANDSRATLALRAPTVHGVGYRYVEAALRRVVQKLTEYRPFADGVGVSAAAFLPVHL